MSKFFSLVFKLIGWHFEGDLPEKDKYVIIGAPHTSNWDLIIGLLGRHAKGIKMKFLAKHQLFVFPFNLIFKALGGIPVNRAKHNNLVDYVCEMYKTHDKFILGLAPEGTRSPSPKWKLGFYHIALKANVPIVMLGLDYRKKALVLTPPYYATGNMKDDLEKILAFYRTISGKYPKKIPQVEDLLT